MNDFEKDNNLKNEFDFFENLENIFDLCVTLNEEKIKVKIATNDLNKKILQLEEAISTPSFYGYLENKIHEKGFPSDSVFYNYIGMSRQTFCKIKKKSSVSRNQALLISVGLGLDYEEAVDFLAYAGYAFKHTSLREQIIAYVMKNCKYDLMVMEEILMIFNQKPLTDI